MDVSAQVLAQELAPFAAHLNLPVAALVLAMLLVLGLLGLNYAASRPVTALC